MRICNIESYRLSSRYSLTAKIPSFEKDKFGTDISKKIAPQESPIVRQAKCLEHYGPHRVSNIGEVISWTAEYPGLFTKELHSITIWHFRL